MTASEELSNTIQSGDYELEDILNKMDALFVYGRITDDEYKALSDMARANAKADASIPDLETRMTALEERVAALEKASESAKTWKAWTKPTSKDQFASYGDGYSYDVDGDGTDEHYLYIDKDGKGAAYRPMLYPASWYKVDDLTLSVDDALKSYEEAQTNA